MIADQQALTDNDKNPKKIVDNLLEVAMRMVIKMINDEPLEEKKFVLPYEIIERESVIEKK